MPSPFTSTTTTENGSAPTVTGEPGAGANEPSPFPSRTLTVSLMMLAVTRSGLPSPFTSTTTTENGPEPTETGEPGAGTNVPSLVPSSTLTVLPPKLAVTRSGRPSPFTSPTDTDDGARPTRNSGFSKSPPPRALPALSLMELPAARLRPMLPAPDPEATVTV